MRASLLAAASVVLLLTLPSASASTLNVDSFENGLGPQYTVTGDLSVTGTWPHVGTRSVEADAQSGKAYAQYRFTASDTGLATISFFDRMDGCLIFAGDLMQYFIVLNKADYSSGNGASVLGVGVATDGSDCFYQYRINDARYTSSVPRTLGWHEFTIAWGQDTALISIDGVAIYEAPYGASPDLLQFGDAWGNLGGVAWWDDLLLAAL